MHTLLTLYVYATGSILLFWQYNCIGDRANELGKFSFDTLTLLVRRHVTKLAQSISKIFHFLDAARKSRQKGRRLNENQTP